MVARAVAVAMSGGVDSTIAALLLKNKGYEVVGVYMHNWDQTDERGSCTADEDYTLVQDVCRHIRVPCTKVNLVKQYWSEVFNSLLEGIGRGWTPNPDILCNQRIKFAAFHDHVTTTLGISTIATGHYARLSRTPCGETSLLQSVDRDKDQTYFLSHVSQEALTNTLFPVGHLTKVKVREIARKEGLDRVNQRKESMGLCFIGKREFRAFISEYMEERSGDFVSLDGEVIGRHEGHHLYTIGQRARLGGRHQPYCVVDKDPVSNVVIVAPGMNHPALYRQSFNTLQPHWITCRSHDFLHQSHDFECLIRHRHQHPLVPCTVSQSADGGLCVTTTKPLRAVTPGQHAVFYHGDECLGGACIAQSTDTVT